MSTIAWGAIHLAVFTALYVYGLIAALIRSVRSTGLTVPSSEFAISALKPMAGLDPFLEENLESFARLEAAPQFEVLLLVDSADDPAAAVARRLVSRYPERFQLIVGKDTRLANPKVASLAHGLRFAKNKLVWFTDSNTEVTNAHLQDLMATWKQSQTAGRQPALIHAPIAAVGGGGVGARFERMHLTAYNQTGYEVSLLAGVKLVVGKSLFTHQDDLRAVGGLESFGDYGGEDYLLGVAFKKQGVVRTTRVAIFQRLGAHTRWRDWYRRQVRWAVVRKQTTLSAFLFGEPWTFFAFSMIPAVLGMLPWSWLAAVLALKTVGDTLLYRAYGGAWLGPIDWLLLPVKELSLLLSWFHGIGKRQINWRGRRLTIEKQIYHEQDDAA